jgi:putative ABC transport system permease protein
LLVLALGTGATTAIFSVVDAVALRPLPFPEPDRIVAVGVRADPAGGGSGPPRASGGVSQRPRPLGAMPGAKPPDPDALMSVTPHDYLEWTDRQHVFESMAAIVDTGDTLLQRPGAELDVVKSQRVSTSFFAVLRARPLLGTAFTAQHALAGSDRVAVVSHAFWQRYFHGALSAVGRSLVLNDQPHTVVGVMPAAFDYPTGSSQAVEVWIPWIASPQDRVRGGQGARALGGVQVVARLAPAVSLDQAQAQMSQVAATIAAATSTSYAGRGIGVRPLRDHLVGTSTRSWMLMLLAAVGFVLLIACANVANLWLARASVQQREAAVRAALGASRGRLVQRVLIESLVVSAAGTVAGLAIAWMCVRGLAAALPETIARVSAIGIDGRVLVVASLAAVVTGLLSGLGPALHGVSPAHSTAISESVRGAGRGRRRARAMLVVAEVAIAVVLLVGAALFIGSFINVMRIEPGFRSDKVLAARLVQPAGPGAAPADIRPALSDIVDRARRLPGVIDAAAAAPGIPFRINLRIGALQLPGQPLDYSKTVSEKVVTASYHRALAIPVVSGRYFTDDDRDGAEAVIILSDAAARLFFGADDPIGRAVVNVGDDERRVVGVVANARQASLEVSPHAEVYLPMAQSRSQSDGFVLLHTSDDPNDALPGLRAIAAQVLPRAPLRNVALLEDLLAAQTAERRLSMLMFALFGLLGLVIAGLVVGGLVAWSLSNAAGRFLFGLDPKDVRAYAIAMITLLAAAGLAALLPARRAASIEPTQALRHE